jgi:hypothetical protein
LEKENGSVKMEIKKLMEELNNERKQNNLLSDKTVEMEMLLCQNKVKIISISFMVNVFQPTRSG